MHFLTEKVCAALGRFRSVNFKLQPGNNRHPDGMRFPIQSRVEKMRKKFRDLFENERPIGTRLEGRVAR